MTFSGKVKPGWEKAKKATTEAMRKNVDALKISSEALDEMIDGAVRWAEHFQTECSARPVN